MKVFISWSGNVSQRVAQELTSWLPAVIQSIEPFISKDIESGARWSPEIARELAESDYGIICVTPDNPGAPWLNFEAGALSKSIERGRVVPYLLGMEPTDLPNGPLTQFQVKRATEDETRKLLTDLNAVTARPLTATALAAQFDMWWPRLAEKLRAIAAEASASPPDGDPPEHRTVEEMLREVLELTRSQQRWFAASRSGTTFEHSREIQASMRRVVHGWKELKYALASTEDVPVEVLDAAQVMLIDVKEFVDYIRAVPDQPNSFGGDTITDVR